MTRTSSPLDEVANSYFDAVIASSPMLATSLGRSERQDEYDDLSPRGVEQAFLLAKEGLEKAEQVEASAGPIDDTDRVTLAAMRERLGLAIESHEASEDLADINNITSGLHAIREVYDLMPMDTEEDWAVIARRLKAVPAAIDQWFESQTAGIESGVLPRTRQVDALVTQIDGWCSDKGFFSGLPARAHDAAPEMPVSTYDDLAEGISLAVDAYRRVAARLLNEVRPVATDVDGIGEERYRLASRSFLGTALDFRETYRWGLDQVAHLEERQAELCAALRPGMTVAETKASLDLDETYLLHGTAAMKEWMQTTADKAISDLDGTHFDIPDPARRIECLIAPTHDGGVYYTDPSDDFSRPGRMWWSVPEGQTTFSTWRELTTVFHEGVPGHHLQLSQAIFCKDSLNTWRRSGVMVSGHAEGWALYAEQLMAELGFLDDPATMLGMLDGQALRAVRVVLDIGLHCGYEAPTEAGGGEWTFDKALSYFNSHVAMDPEVARFEVLRYFGWPGQAPSYKVGQRVWTETRDAVKARDGASFDLKGFHARALSLGALGLDTLRAAVLG